MRRMLKITRHVSTEYNTPVILGRFRLALERLGLSFGIHGISMNAISMGRIHIRSTVVKLEPGNRIIVNDKHNREIELTEEVDVKE